MRRFPSIHTTKCAGSDGVVVAIPIVVGALGTIKISLTVNLERLPVEINTTEFSLEVIRKSLSITRLELGM